MTEVEIPLTLHEELLEKSRKTPLRLHEKLLGIASQCSLIENEEVATGLVLASLINEHVAMFGSPGTGKSATSKRFCKSVTGTKHFYKLLSRDMAPDEILVSDFIINEWVDEDGHKRTQFAKNVSGMLPDCEIAFLDEGFKANGATLNKTLDIILDREYMMNGKMHVAKTQTVIIASNEMPEDECKAFYDRILFRFLVLDVKEPQSFFDLLTFEFPEEMITITMEELKQAQDLVRLVPVPKQIRNKLYELFRELDDEGLQQSNRRWKALYKVMQASAWMDGKEEVDEEAMEFLQHCLWYTADKGEIKKVRDIVLKAVNPLKQQILNKYEEGLDVIREVYDQKVDDERQKQAIEANTKLKKIAKQMEKLIEQISDKGKPTAKYDELHNKLIIKKSELVTDCLGVPGT